MQNSLKGHAYSTAGDTDNTATMPIDTFQSILNPHWKEVLGGTVSTHYFRTEDLSRFKQIFSEFTASREEHPAVYFCNYDGPEFHIPYEPYIGLVRAYLRIEGIDPETLLSEVSVYPPLRPIFTAYLSDRIPSRKDILIPEEVLYEQRQIRRSIFALLQYISRKRPIIIAISGLRNTGPSIHDLIQFIHEEGKKGRIMFLYSFSGQLRWLQNTEQEHWEAFLRFVDEAGSILSIPQDPSTSLQEASGDYAPPAVELAQLNYSFLAFDEALTCAEAASHAVAAFTGPEGDALQYSLLNTTGDSYYYSNRMNQALINYQALTEKAQRDDNKEQLSLSYVKTGFAYLITGDIESAKRFTQLNLKLTESIGTPDNLMRAYYFCYLLSVRNSTFIDREMYFALKELLKAPGLENMYANLCGNAVSYAMYFNGMDDLIEACDESLKYYRANHNEFGLSLSYHKMAIIYANYSHFDEANTYMKKCLRLRERLKDPLRVVHVLNGFGYLNYVTGNYSRAHNCFRRAIRSLTHINNYDEVIATLYNFSTLYFMTGHYDRCIAILDKILKIMHIIQNRYFPYHCLEDVYILKGLCLVKTDSASKALEIIYRLRADPRQLPWKARSLFSLLQAMMAARQGEMEKADELFGFSLGALKGGDEENPDMLPLFYFEYGNALLLNGRTEDARRILSEGIGAAAAAGMDYQESRLRTLLENGPGHDSEFPLPEVAINLDSLEDLARKEFILGKLQNKIRDIRFLNIIQTELMQLNNRLDVAQKLIKLVYYHFPMEISSFNLAGGTDLETPLAGNTPEGISPDSLLPLYRMAAAIPAKRIFTDHEIRRGCPELPARILSLVSIPIMRGTKPVAWLFLATRKDDVSLSGEDLEMLMVTASHIGILFEKIHHEEEIMRISRHDALSGLFNRQALQSRIKEESAKLQGRRTTDTPTLSVAFIDLDNFKYYNDTFGHNVGDLIIIEFSNLLMRNFREIDFIARFGGDEFIILMPETTSQMAKIPLLRIFTHLEKRNFFIDEIEHSLAHRVTIPGGDGLDVGKDRARPGFARSGRRENQLVRDHPPAGRPRAV